MKTTIQALCAAVALAGAAHAPAQPAAAASASAAQALPTEGEVRKIDKSAGKLTLKHGPIANLDMPAMTMVFQVSNPKLLDAVKEGDKVRFKAEKLNGAYTVTGIDAAKR